MISKFEKFLFSSLCDLKPSSRLACAWLPLAMQNLLSTPLTPSLPFYLWSAPIVRKSFPTGRRKKLLRELWGAQDPQR